MAKLTIKQDIPAPPPPKTYVLELTEREAMALTVLTGGVGGTAHEIDVIFNVLDADDKFYNEGLTKFSFKVDGRTPRIDTIGEING